MPTHYAHLDTMTVHALPLTHGLDAFEDVYATDVPGGFPNGVYRRITSTFLRWLDLRVKLASQAGSKVPQAEREKASAFLKRCCDATGLQPSQKSLPSGYSRPTIDSAFEFTGSWCIWDNTTPKGFEDMKARANRDSIAAAEASAALDVDPQCPYVLPLVRGPGLPPVYVHRTKIPQQATEYHGIGENWFPIRPQWKVGYVPQQNPLDDFFK